MPRKVSIAVLAFSICIGIMWSNQGTSGDKAKTDPPKPQDPPAAKGKDKPKAQPKPIKVAGQLKTTDPLDFQMSSSYHKVHTVKLKAGFRYSISINAPFPPFLRIEDHRGNQRALTNQYNAKSVSVDFAPTKDEYYRIVVASRASRRVGAYTINVNAKQTLLTIKDKLTAKDPFDRVRGNGYRCKVHKLKMVPGKTYTLHCTTISHDGWLRLEDSAKNQLASNDDWMNTRNSRIVFTPRKADTYRIIVTTFSRNATGPYTLTVSK